MISVVSPSCEVSESLWGPMNFNVPWFEDFWRESQLRKYCYEEGRDDFEEMMCKKLRVVRCPEEEALKMRLFLLQGLGMFAQHYLVRRLENRRVNTSFALLLGSTVDMAQVNAKSANCTVKMLASLREVNRTDRLPDAVIAEFCSLVNVQFSDRIRLAVLEKGSRGLDGLVIKDRQCWEIFKEQHEIRRELIPVSSSEPEIKMGGKRL